MSKHGSEKNAPMKFFLCVTHNELSQRGTTRSQNRHKNKTTIQRPYKFFVTSTHYDKHSVLRISNAIGFSVS